MLRIEISLRNIVVTVNILAQESNLLNSLLIQALDFLQDGI